MAGDQLVVHDVDHSDNFSFTLGLAMESTMSPDATTPDQLGSTPPHFASGCTATGQDHGTDSVSPLEWSYDHT